MLAPSVRDVIGSSIGLSTWVQQNRLQPGLNTRVPSEGIEPPTAGSTVRSHMPNELEGWSAPSTVPDLSSSTMLRNSVAGFSPSQTELETHHTTPVG